MIRFVSNEGVGRGTRLLNAETGEDLSDIVPVSAVNIEIVPDGVVSATCKLALVAADITAGRTQFLALHPVSKDLSPVAAIEFRDGWRVTFSEDGTPRVSQKIPTR